MSEIIFLVSKVEWRDLCSCKGAVCQLRHVNKLTVVFTHCLFSTSRPHYNRSNLGCWTNDLKHAAGLSLECNVSKNKHELLLTCRSLYQMGDTDRQTDRRSCGVVLGHSGKVVGIVGGVGFAVLLVLDPKSIVKDKEHSRCIGRLLMCWIQHQPCTSNVRYSISLEPPMLDTASAVDLQC